MAPGNPFLLWAMLFREHLKKGGQEGLQVPPAEHTSPSLSITDAIPLRLGLGTWL